MAWFDQLYLSTVKSISFSQKKAIAAKSQAQPGQEGMVDANEEVFSCADFLVTDDNGQVCSLKSSIFEEIKP